MTVQELIDRLRTHSPDALVVVQMGKTEQGNGKPVGVVESVEAQRYGDREDWTEVWDWIGPFPVEDGYSEPQRVVNLTSG